MTDARICRSATRLAALLLSLAGLSVNAGCSNDDEPPPEPALVEPNDDEPPPAPALVEPTLAEDVKTGSLAVQFRYTDGTSVYAEGARHYLEVSTSDGAVVVRRDEGTEQGPGAGYTDSVRLAPGEYEVQSFQRECDFTEGGDCRETFKSAKDQCSTPVEIEPGAKVRVIIRLRLPGECDVAVS